MTDRTLMLITAGAVMALAPFAEHLIRGAAWTVTVLLVVAGLV